MFKNSKNEKALILFDIDKTLIDIMPIQIEAFYNYDKSQKFELLFFRLYK